MEDFFFFSPPPSCHIHALMYKIKSISCTRLQLPSTFKQHDSVQVLLFSANALSVTTRNSCLKGCYAASALPPPPPWRSSLSFSFLISIQALTETCSPVFFVHHCHLCLIPSSSILGENYFVFPHFHHYKGRNGFGFCFVFVFWGQARIGV